MDPITLAALMAGIGGMSNASKEKSAREDYVNDLTLQAEQSRYAPYTGQGAQAAKREKAASVLEGILVGGMGGLKQGQELKAAGIDLGGTSGEDIDLESLRPQASAKSKLSDKIDFTSKY